MFLNYVPISLGFDLNNYHFIFIHNNFPLNILFLQSIYHYRYSFYIKLSYPGSDTKMNAENVQRRYR